MKHDDSENSLAAFFGKLSMITKSHPLAVPDLVTFFRGMAELSERKNESDPALLRPESTIDQMAQLFISLSAFEDTARRSAVHFDPWKVMGLGRNEVRNCRVLGWVLDPDGTHGCRADVLNVLIEKLRFASAMTRANDDDLIDFPFPDVVDDFRVTLELSPFADRSRRVDIVLDGPDYCVFIEVKIDAIEGFEQTKTYLDLVERRAKAMGKNRWGVLFLAPRILPQISAEGPRVLQATWSQLARAIEASLSSRSIRTPAGSALAQFANHIRSF